MLHRLRLADNGWHERQLSPIVLLPHGAHGAEPLQHALLSHVIACAMHQVATAILPLQLRQAEKQLHLGQGDTADACIRRARRANVPRKSLQAECHPKKKNTKMSDRCVRGRMEVHGGIFKYAYHQSAAEATSHGDVLVFSPQVAVLGLRFFASPGRAATTLEQDLGVVLGCDVKKDKLGISLPPILQWRTT